MMEDLFVSDFTYLQDLYRIVNFEDPTILDGAGARRPFPAERSGRWVRALRDDELWQEIAYLAYHLHWDLDRLLDLEHGDRLRMLQEVGGLNTRAWEGADRGRSFA